MSAATIDWMLIYSPVIHWYWRVILVWIFLFFVICCNFHFRTYERVASDWLSCMCRIFRKALTIAVRIYQHLLCSEAARKDRTNPRYFGNLKVIAVLMRVCFLRRMFLMRVPVRALVSWVLWFSQLFFPYANDCRLNWPICFNSSGPLTIRLPMIDFRRTLRVWESAFETNTVKWHITYSLLPSCSADCPTYSNCVFSIIDVHVVLFNAYEINVFIRNDWEHCEKTNFNNEQNALCASAIHAEAW